jgi:hypothetical protein
VQWKEWGKKSTSWEPEHLLQNCDKLIDKFFQDDLDRIRRDNESKKLMTLSIPDGLGQNFRVLETVSGV